MMRRLLAGKGILWQFSIASLVVIAVIGVALAWGLSDLVRRHAVKDLMEEADDTLVSRILDHLSPDDLATPMSSTRLTEFQHFVEESVISQRTARLKLWNTQGTVIYSTDLAQVGQSFPIKDELAKALAGRMVGELSGLEAEENAAERPLGRLLEVYVPIVFPGSSQVAGAFEIYQYYDPVARFVAGAKRYIFGGLGTGLALLYVSLFAIVKSGADTISRQQRHLEEQAQELEETYEMTLGALCASLDMRDHETEGHALRVSQLTVALAQEMGTLNEQLKSMEYGALLHDVGKIGVPDAVLNKAGPLSEDEWAEMRKHPFLGYLMLSDIKFLFEAAEMVWAHHERYDGKGYPRGLAGEAIPLGSRIFAVVDAYDAITSNRPYRKARSQHDALADIQRNYGSQFDPAVVTAFKRLIERGSLAAASTASGLSESPVGA
ncbi:MAG: HD-GYP domain-containing protein [Chloroflexi bacterium]|nr:HD-GYP domain-containing protein [Chloroflexota bacterium]